MPRYAQLLVTAAVACMLLGLHDGVRAQQASRLSLECADAESGLAEARRSGDPISIEGAAKRYLTACRPSRSKTELSTAMADLASLRRSEKRHQESLTYALDCIRFEYLALGCHIEKALALEGLGLHEQAKDVLKTGLDVVEKLKAAGLHELAQAEEARQRSRSPDYESRVRRARVKLSMAQSGEPYIRNLMKVLG